MDYLAIKFYFYGINRSITVLLCLFSNRLLFQHSTAELRDIFDYDDDVENFVVENNCKIIDD